MTVYIPRSPGGLCDTQLTWPYSRIPGPKDRFESQESACSYVSAAAAAAATYKDPTA